MMSSSTAIDMSALAAAFEIASPADRETFAGQLAHDAAIVAIFNQPPLFADGSNIYLVDESWHMQEALNDPRFVAVHSRRELDAFLSQQDVDTAVISKAAAISLPELEQIISRAPYSKTVLWDATQQ